MHPAGNGDVLPGLAVFSWKTSIDPALTPKLCFFLHMTFTLWTK